MGMKLTAEDIYSVNQGSLKDAIVHFGGFCTSELISANGLLLTNHHCGYGRIQSHSTLENNYLNSPGKCFSSKSALYFLVIILQLFTLFSQELRKSSVKPVYDLSKLALIPLGGSTVILDPFCRINTGNLLLGILVNHRRKSLCTCKTDNRNLI